jgi:hypothetical protein
MTQGWHKWFAWYPVPLCAPIPGKRVWWRTVARLHLNGETFYDQAFRADPPPKKDDSLAGAMERSLRHHAK